MVNAGVLEHPLGGGQVVGLVAIGGSRKLRNLRADRRVTIVVRAGWRWATVEGDAEIIGPDDPHPDVDGEALRLLLRDIFRAAGGTHDDWDTYDRVMAEDRRAAVLIVPRRIKCDPDVALELRARHPAVRPGYHQNKRHWNTVELDGSVDDGELGWMIDHSYELVVANLPRAVRDRLHSS